MLLYLRDDLKKHDREWRSEAGRRSSPKWVYELSRLQLDHLELNPMGYLRKNVQRTPQFSRPKSKEVEVFHY